MLKRDPMWRSKGFEELAFPLGQTMQETLNGGRSAARPSIWFPPRGYSCPVSGQALIPVVIDLRGVCQTWQFRRVACIPAICAAGFIDSNFDGVSQPGSVDRPRSQEAPSVATRRAQPQALLSGEIGRRSGTQRQLLLTSPDYFTNSQRQGGGFVR